MPSISFRWSHNHPGWHHSAPAAGVYQAQDWLAVHHGSHDWHLATLEPAAAARTPRVLVTRALAPITTKSPRLGPIRSSALGHDSPCFVTKAASVLNLPEAAFCADILSRTFDSNVLKSVVYTRPLASMPTYRWRVEDPQWTSHGRAYLRSSPPP